MRRAALQARSAVQRALEPPSVAARAVAAFGELVGAPVTVTTETAGPDLATTLASHSVSFRLTEPATAAQGTPWWMVLDVEVGLVVGAVAHVMKRPAPRVLHAGLATPAMVGAFAAILAAAVRRAGVPVVVAALAEGAGRSLAADDVTVAGVTVEADRQATHVRAFFPSSLLANPSAPFQRAQLADLGDVPLALPVVAARTLATPAELAALAVGDVWMLGDAWGLGRSAASLRGRVWLCPAMGERGVAADVEGDERIVLRDEVEELSWSPMNDETDESALVAAVGDVPVVVRVELGAATMKAKEWSALKPGDVLGLGSKIGGPVTLRVSGLAVAEGELVDLEGEVGIRIRRRLPDPPR